MTTTTGCRHGTEVAGRYRIGPVVGSTAGRCTHDADDTALRRPVRVTFADPAPGTTLPHVLPLPQSAWHGHEPGLTEIYDGGVDDDTLFLVTERPDDDRLADDLAGRFLTAAEVREIGSGIARALRPTHRRGWAHGALAVDAVSRGPSGTTVAGLGVGEWFARWAGVPETSPHPAPEQLDDRPVSPATDVFALGEILAGCAGPLDGDDGLTALLARMTADRPDDRPTTDDVLRCLTDPDLIPVAARVPAVPLVPTTAVRRRARPAAAVLAAIAVAALFGMGGAFAAGLPSAIGAPGGATVGVSSAPGPATPDVPVIAAEGLDLTSGAPRALRMVATPSESASAGRAAAAHADVRLTTGAPAPRAAAAPTSTPAHPTTSGSTTPVKPTSSGTTTPGTGSTPRTTASEATSPRPTATTTTTDRHLVVADAAEEIGDRTDAAPPASP